VIAFRGANYIVPPVFAVTAPPPVALMAIKIAVTAGRMLLAADPALGLVDEPPDGWAILKLTGGYAFGLLLPVVMLRRVMRCGF